ncbi:hypothetical protein J2Y45_001563 [Dyadobacter sp. BE34]|uniref:Uncharacterized protein n=1 Tax=Dyadobacter fermentans TaxID=94254 RepID=A0ABU1QUE9_9BACT|nr:hypothetical protein [Dyadobacter fermentans]MDR7042034.1 hypothetical protein [Dyadobacter sp. BE242]MDR7196437.1 hypothetical protein [Dyadobacter sp. BE34]MDR7213018.1 hypothetical protein [Dyadobacter sp. BE31]MDR7261843.1 hypothetical protein [Dyadobacter sp. BE32]
MHCHTSDYRYNYLLLLYINIIHAIPYKHLQTRNN